MEGRKKIIVTGGAGFIGSHTVVSLYNKGYDPILIDDFRNSRSFVIGNIEKIIGVPVKHYDIDCNSFEEMDRIVASEQPYGIIHFAADKAVGESVELPLKYYDNNVGSLINILRACKNHQIPKLVFSSSCTVYGDPDEVPVNEESPIKETASPYGYTKQIGERVCTDFNVAYPDTQITLLRYFNPIGAHPSGLIGELPLGVPNNLVPYVSQTALGIRETLTIFGDDYSTDDGTCIRDYIHVCDLASAHVLAIENKSKALNIYNVGTGRGSSVLEIVNAYEKANNLKLNFKIGPRRVGDAPKIWADPSKIISELGWKPEYSLEDALKHAHDWQKNVANYE